MEVSEMAEIGGMNVFTNGNADNNTGDLLQQAFQQVADDDEQEADFVTLLQSDDGEVIQLTAEQAAALGITFKVDDGQDLEQASEWTTPIGEQQEQQSLSPEDSQRIINELTRNGLLKHNKDTEAVSTDFDNWTAQQDAEKYAIFEIN